MSAVELLAALGQAVVGVVVVGIVVVVEDAVVVLV